MKKTLFWAIIFALFSLLSSLAGYWIERDFGRLEVKTVEFMTDQNAPMIAKLYRPKTATSEHPAPGLLALHGYQSDKEATNTFGALELAKRGFVVLAIDHFGHGYSTARPASNKTISGANNGYQYLKSLPLVDKNRLGIFGHSTGALNAIRVAKINPDHKAVNGLSSNGGDPSLHNYLLIQGQYEEIGGYREKNFPVKELVHNANRLKAFSLPDTATLEWGKLYGDFREGTARKAVLVGGTHLGVMISEESNRHAIQWFSQALNNADQSDLNAQTYWYKEFSGLFALFFALVSALFVVSGLLKTAFFARIQQKVSEKTPHFSGSWWKLATINIIFTAITYPIFTQWGGANEPLAARFDFLPLEMGNGILTWLLINAGLNLVFFLLWQRGKNLRWQAVGLTSSNTVGLVLKSLLLALAALSWLYGITALAHAAFGQELRFLWPLLKTLTSERWTLLPLYWGLLLGFFFVFNGLIVSIQMKRPLIGSFTATLVSWTLHTAIFAAGGLMLLWLFHFVPDFFEIGPGFDLIGLPQFGGRWMMMLAVIIPQFIVLSLLNHWCFLKTGYIWLGVFFTSGLMAWMLVGGQVIGRFLA